MQMFSEVKQLELDKYLLISLREIKTHVSNAGGPLKVAAEAIGYLSEAAPSLLARYKTVEALPHQGQHSRGPPSSGTTFSRH